MNFETNVVEKYRDRELKSPEKSLRKDCYPRVAFT
jgi:hypothetical protein